MHSYILHLITTLFTVLVIVTMASSSPAAFSARYGTIATQTVQEGVMRATINNPPISLLDKKIATDLVELLRYLSESAETKVVIFDSANPDFFIA